MTPREEVDQRVADVITVTSAARVTCVKVPWPIVDTPISSRRQEKSGTRVRYQMNAIGIRTNDGTSHFTDQRTTVALSWGRRTP